MKINDKIQQGDVLLKKVDYKIDGKKLDHLVLAHGEGGHKHQLIDGLGQLIMMDNIMHLEIFSDKALLKHEKHGNIKLDKGKYKVWRVLEYDHFLEEAREVLD